MEPLSVDEALERIVMPVTLIGSSWGGKDNVMTASWVMSSSKKPPLVSIYIYNRQFTRDLISKSGEFVVNVLGSDQAELSQVCGTTSGRKADKYKKAKLRTRQADQVSVPLIEGCLANLECKVVAEHDVGDHTLFVGEIVAAHAGDRTEPLVFFARNYANIVSK